MLRTAGRRLVLWLVVLAACAYPLSGIYVVRVNETGVLKRFGRIVNDRVAPGLHYRIPWPVDRIMRVATRDIHRFQSGFGADPQKVVDLEREYGPLDRAQLGSFIVPYCITGDKNIIHVKVIAQYRIDDRVRGLSGSRAQVHTIGNPEYAQSRGRGFRPDYREGRAAATDTERCSNAAFDTEHRNIRVLNGDQECPPASQR